MLQIQAFSRFVQTTARDNVRSDWKLLLVGGVRNAEDERRVAALQALISELHLEASRSVFSFLAKGGDFFEWS